MLKHTLHCLHFSVLLRYIYYSSSVYILTFSCALLGSMCHRCFSSFVLFLTQPALKRKCHLYHSMRQLLEKTSSQTNQNILCLVIYPLSQLMRQYMNGTKSLRGEVYRCHSLERMLGEHKLYGWWEQ